MKALMIAALASLPVTVQGIWPEHGLFYVQESIESGERICRFRAEAEVQGKPFALVLTPEPSGRLTVQLLARDDRLKQAENIWIGFDRKSVFHVNVEALRGEPAMRMVVGQTQDGGRQVADLEKAATGAEWFMVAAPPYTQAIPAKGAAEALDDLVKCASLRKQVEFP